MKVELSYSSDTDVMYVRMADVMIHPTRESFYVPGTRDFVLNFFHNRRLAKQAGVDENAPLYEFYFLGSVAVDQPFYGRAEWYNEKLRQILGPIFDHAYNLWIEKEDFRSFKLNIPDNEMTDTVEVWKGEIKRHFLQSVDSAHG